MAVVERENQEFLDLVVRYDGQGRPLSPNPGARNYAPKVIAKVEGGKKRREREAALERTMNALFDADKLFAVVDGYPSFRQQKEALSCAGESLKEVRKGLLSDCKRRLSGISESLEKLMVRTPLSDPP
jgi:hypothetical protein